MNESNLLRVLELAEDRLTVIEKNLVKLKDVAVKTYEEVGELKALMAEHLKEQRDFHKHLLEDQDRRGSRIKKLEEEMDLVQAAIIVRQGNGAPQ